MKICANCTQEFLPRPKALNRKYCYACPPASQIWAKKNRQRMQELQDNWRKLHPDKRRQIDRRSKLKRHGLTEKQFAAILTAQNGCCAICKTATPAGRSRQWIVDHDHRTSKRRALLCNRCNIILGQVDDSRKILEAAIDYLERFAKMTNVNLADSMMDGGQFKQNEYLKETFRCSACGCDQFIEQEYIQSAPNAYRALGCASCGKELK